MVQWLAQRLEGSGLGLADGLVPLREEFACCLCSCVGFLRTHFAASFLPKLKDVPARPIGYSKLAMDENMGGNGLVSECTLPLA